MTSISEQLPAHHDPNARLPIWETFGLTFRVFGRAPGKFIGLILINILVSGLLALLGKLADGESWAPIMATAIEIANLAVQLIVNGAFVVGIDDILRRGTFDFDGALVIGSRRIGALLGVGLLQFLVVFLAFLLLVVPGIVASLMFCVAIPVCVLEQLGPIRSLDRSKAITKGSRWRILGLGIPVLLTTIVVLAVIVTAAKMHLLIVAIPLGFVLFVGFMIVALVLPTVLYLQLRGIEDGSGPVTLPSALD